jgi:hypothetical protein
MSDVEHYNTHWTDFELGLRIASGAVALGGALIIGPMISTFVAEFVGNFVEHFHGEAPVLAAKAGAVAASWGFVFGVIYGCGGWLRYVWMPKLRAKVDADIARSNAVVVRRR